MQIMDLFYSPNQDKTVTHGNLPHWTQQGKLHFVTFRLAGSLPKERLEQILRERQRWDECHCQPYSEQDWQEYHCLFSERIENWLDAGHGECFLSQPQYARIVAGALQHFDKQRYFLDHWVIMPNHVHVLLIPIKPYTLKDILHSWKSYTANEINAIQHCDGTLWQHESFDHIVRNERQLERFRQYILDNYKKSNGSGIVSECRII
jgi:REP element-mobilizing transposase RayT